MSITNEKPVSAITFWLVLSLIISCVLAGLGLRIIREESTPGVYRDGELDLHLVRFLSTAGINDVRRVHYTRDAGIRGLQVALPDCEGYLQLVVMPEGDEFLGLWNLRASSVGYQIGYLFRGELYDEFPSFVFWAHTMAYSLAQRIQLYHVPNPGAVIAMAYPPQCLAVRLIPWHRFETTPLITK